MEPPSFFGICRFSSLTQLCAFQTGSKPEDQYGARYSKAGFVCTSREPTRKLGRLGMFVAHGVHQRTMHCSCKKWLTAYIVPRGRPPASNKYFPLVRMANSSGPYL